jgi:ABC-type lipoprotein release transport system permease subunit
MITQTLMLVQISLRNLLASKINLLIGGLLLLGTFFFVVFGALLDTLGDSMSKSVVGSVAGHIQIYSSKSKDELSLYGTMGGDPDLSAITEFPKIKQALESLPNVKTVVPMGTSGALITAGNTVDMTLEKLRELYKVRDGTSTKPGAEKLGPAEVAAQIDSQKNHVRQIVKVLQGDSEKAGVMLDVAQLDADAKAALDRVSGDQFWKGFEADPYESMEFLENKIAPQVTDGNMMFLRYVGTDLDTFQTSFDRMQIVDGQPVPAGRRGFLIAKFFYEEFMKLKNARRLDKIKEGLATGTKTIASDPDLQRYVKENSQQTREMVLQLDALKTKTAVERLQKFLGEEKESDLTTLLARFFTMTDENFAQRYAFFYADVAPLLELYRVRVGDTLTIKAFTKAGYVKSVNVKVYGTFSFTGIEKSPLAGQISLMDLMSFRDLYGYLTADNTAELKQMKEATAAKEITREGAEDSLFGEGTNNVVAEATAGIIDDKKELTGVAKTLRQEDLIRRVYNKDEIESGVVLNAAVILKDPKLLKETIVQINALSESQGLSIKAISWQQAAGILGQVINFIAGLLLGFVAILFLLAMIVINNAVMMATLQRTQTFGTLRAIGAQRPFVLLMVLIESVVLGLVFGSVGMILGSVVVAILGNVGIPAFNDYMYFFFSGPKLLPVLNFWNLLIAIVLVLVATTVSTLIPAINATRVSPLAAMQSDE